jgi:hypothetical protein
MPDLSVKRFLDRLGRPALKELGSDTGVCETPRVILKFSGCNHSLRGCSLRDHNHCMDLGYNHDHAAHRTSRTPHDRHHTSDDRSDWRCRHCNR